MNREFIELSLFRSCWDTLGLGEDELRDLELRLLTNPDAGDMIPGCGGARKLRISMPGRGRSGGARVIYVDFLARGWMYLLFAYPKNVQENLTSEQKKVIRAKIKTLLEE
ncbi:hypothetical protein FACS1894191_6690 [Clostridia bacterium]|nr:hypothetical protein FACS1894191_6690 [Clostridia bacterium]